MNIEEGINLTLFNPVTFNARQFNSCVPVMPVKRAYSYLLSN